MVFRLVEVAQSDREARHSARGLGVAIGKTPSHGGETTYKVINMDKHGKLGIPCDNQGWLAGKSTIYG